MNKIIVYDSDHPGAFQNKCFELGYATQGPGHVFTVLLAQKARLQGFEIMTGDVFLAEQKKCVAFCITDMHSKRTEKILQRGAVPILCMSTESPLIARDFYINIKKYAGRFAYNIQFKGTLDRLVDTKTVFLPMYYPTDSRSPLPLKSWKNRNFLVLVNRNKRIFRSSTINIKQSIISLASRIKVEYQKIIDPWIRSRELYKDRIESILFFSKRNDFHLYGQGWENPIPGFPVQYQSAAKKAFQGSIETDQKLNVMSNYKFVICFENCVFPGYVTEKIFDCFLAGCIPVYFGAPDIEEFVPKDSFIDFRKFTSFSDLENYLLTFSEIEAAKMLESAKTFLLSEAFDKYYTPNIVEDILKKISNYSETVS